MAGTTIKIHRSRALSFKKLSFLYLVFIVFYFFSTSGDYIKQYEPMSKTQRLLNQLLLEELNTIECKNLEDIALKNNTNELVNHLEKINSELHQYIGKSITIDEKLKELKFSKNFVENGNLENLESELKTYINLFPESQRNSLMSEFKIDEQSQKRMFTNIPNGFMDNIFQNFQTIALRNAIQVLNSRITTIENTPKVVQFPKPENENSPFLQSLKSTYYLGEEVQFSLHSNSEQIPLLKVNQTEIKLNQSGKHTYSANWTPTQSGIYTVWASNSENQQSQQIEVKSVDLKFIENLQEVVCNMNESFTLTPYLSNDLAINDFKFTSNEAKIEIEGNHLKITPFVEGRFNLKVELGNQTVENLSLFSKINSAPTVFLKDKYNHNTTLANAYSLSTEHGVWQVVEFSMIVVNPDGVKQTFHANNRFMTIEMLNAQKNMLEGSSVIFEQIKLVFNDGIKTTSGRPIYIQK